MNEIRYWLSIVLLAAAAVLLVVFSHDSSAGEKDRPFYIDELNSLQTCPDTDETCTNGDALPEVIIKLGREPDKVAPCTITPGCAVAVYTDDYGYGVILTIRYEHLWAIWVGYPSALERPKGSAKARAEDI